MTNVQAHQIADAVIDSLKATSAVEMGRALERARGLAQEHVEANRQQPTKKIPDHLLGHAPVKA